MGADAASEGSQRPEQVLNVGELRELIELVATNGITDFQFEREGFRLRLRRESAAEAVAPLAPTGASSAAPLTNASADASTASSSAITSTISHEARAEIVPDAGENIARTGSASDQHLYIITSPIVGTYYQSPSPSAAPFVHIGDQVDPDKVVCIIEAMKLMNEIQAETSGIVERIYVENGQAVEYGQKLFGVRK